MNAMTTTNPIPVMFQANLNLSRMEYLIVSRCRLNKDILLLIVQLLGGLEHYIVCLLWGLANK